MPSALQRWLPLALLAGLALALRTWELDHRPMHADEANQAVKTGELLEGRGYTFEPADHHGPTLYYAVLPVAWMRGEHTLKQLTETTVRLVPALAGTAAVVLLYFFALPLGRWPALVAAGFLALSPPAVYYSRYFIQETLLLTFVLGALLCTKHWWRDGRLGWAIGGGLCAGLMQATKSSAPLFFVAALAGLAAARPGPPTARHLVRDITAALLAAFLLAGLFYSSFGTNLRGLADALSTYASFGNRLAGDTGHEKSWWYYLSLFGWQRDGGVLTQQVLFFILALAGLVIALISNRHPLLRWTAVFTVMVVLVLSFTSYKTPWHSIHFVPGFALLAAGALAALPDHIGCRLIAAGLALGVATSQAQQVRLTSFQRPADERNPYAYVHASADVLKLRTLVEQVPAGQPIRVISEEVWPLPWYLRGLPNVGYWTTVPDVCDGPLVIASAGLAEQVQARLHGNYQTGFIGLRPGFVLVVFTRQP